MARFSSTTSFSFPIPPPSSFPPPPPLTSSSPWLVARALSCPVSSNGTSGTTRPGGREGRQVRRGVDMLDDGGETMRFSGTRYSKVTCSRTKISISIPLPLSPFLSLSYRIPVSLFLYVSFPLSPCLCLCLPACFPVCLTGWLPPYPSLPPSLPVSLHPSLNLPPPDLQHPLP